MERGRFFLLGVEEAQIPPVQILKIEKGGALILQLCLSHEAGFQGRDKRGYQENPWINKLRWPRWSMRR
jgi:hypothetical protein